MTQQAQPLTFETDRFELELPEFADRVDVRVLTDAFEKLNANAAHLLIGNHFVGDQTVDGDVTVKNMLRLAPDSWINADATSIFLAPEGGNGSGNVRIVGSARVDSDLVVGWSVSATSLSVSETANVATLNAQALSVHTDAAVARNLTVFGSLAAPGTATIGTVSATWLDVAYDASVGRNLSAASVGAQRVVVGGWDTGAMVSVNGEVRVGWDVNVDRNVNVANMLTTPVLQIAPLGGRLMGSTGTPGAVTGLEGSLVVNVASGAAFSGYYLTVHGPVMAGRYDTISSRATKSDLWPLAELSPTRRVQYAPLQIVLDERIHGYSYVHVGDDPETAGRTFGFLADEWEQVAPEVVSHDRNGEVLGLSYDSITPILYEAMRELAARVAALEAKLP
jgi:hypothetical protein